MPPPKSIVFDQDGRPMASLEYMIAYNALRQNSRSLDHEPTYAEARLYAEPPQETDEPVADDEPVCSDLY